MPETFEELGGQSELESKTKRSLRSSEVKLNLGVNSGGKAFEELGGQSELGGKIKRNLGS
jgi:hypothetical protein